MGRVFLPLCLCVCTVHLRDCLADYMKCIWWSTVQAVSEIRTCQVRIWSYMNLKSDIQRKATWRKTNTT
jgi:hypothetical protein